MLVNIYAPNNIHAQQMFFKKLSEMLRSYANSLSFIGGDFNCPLENEDKMGGQDLSSKKNVITEIKQLMGSFDLVDIWRYLNPRENQFTWSSSDLSQIQIGLLANL